MTQETSEARACGAARPWRRATVAQARLPGVHSLHMLLSIAGAIALAATGCADVADGPGNAPIAYWPIPIVGRDVNAAASVDAGVPRDAGLATSPAPPVPVAPPPPRQLPDASSEPAADAGPAMQPDDRLELFDAAKVYVLGTLAEGSCDAHAVAMVEKPNEAIAGFSCDLQRFAKVRPSDGRLLYLDSSPGIRVFHCDGCRYAGPDVPLPERPGENDEILAAPPCSAEQGVRIDSLLVAPDGSTAHGCNGRMYDSSGRELASDIEYLGYADTALTSVGIVELGSGRRRPFQGLPARPRIARRAQQEGYSLVLAEEEAPAAPELWFVDFTGEAVLVGVYPDPPPEQTTVGPPMLDAWGGLYQMAQDTSESFRDTIVFRTVGGRSEVVYDEHDDPVLKLHISDLFTGP